MKKLTPLRATKKVNVPVVMTREETAKVITMMEGRTQLAVKLLYGSGLRMSEIIRLRMQDINHIIRKLLQFAPGKGAKIMSRPHTDTRLNKLPVFNSLNYRINAL